MRNYKGIVVILRCFGIIVSLITISVIFSCQNSDNSQKETQTNEPSENSLDSNIYNMYCCNRLQTLDENEFHSILRDLCSQELWSARDLYDACNWLMIPMHYAFKAGDDYAIDQFNKLFERFVRYYLTGGATLIV